MSYDLTFRDTSAALSAYTREVLRRLCADGRALRLLAQLLPDLGDELLDRGEAGVVLCGVVGGEAFEEAG